MEKSEIGQSSYTKLLREMEMTESESNGELESMDRDDMELVKIPEKWCQLLERSGILLKCYLKICTPSLNLSSKLAKRVIRLLLLLPLKSPKQKISLRSGVLDLLRRDQVEGHMMEDLF
jgi:hypothetical protein